VGDVLSSPPLSFLKATIRRRRRRNLISETSLRRGRDDGDGLRSKKKKGEKSPK